MSENGKWNMKYRPKSLSEYMGEDLRGRVLNRFSSHNKDKLPQVILAYGHFGCGKTTVARLIAKEFHCIDKESNNGHACGKCEMCEEVDKLIETGNAPLQLIQEINIATEGNKKNIDKILDEAKRAPMYPQKYKVLILDEVHRAPKDTQNSLLKDLEEPPEHLVFILCTTDENELLKTVLSRCSMKIEVRRADKKEMLERLKYISEKEKLKISIEALERIINYNNCIPRDCINMLEEVALSCNRIVSLESLEKMLNTTSINYYLDYFKLANKGLDEILKFAIDMDSIEGMSYDKFLNGLTRFVLDCIYARTANKLDRFSASYLKDISALFKMYDIDEIDYLLQVTEQAEKSFKSGINPELVFITTAMRISKVKILSKGLRESLEEVDKDNKKGTEKYLKIKEESKSKNVDVEKREIEDSLLESVFGNSIKELKENNEVSFEIEEDDDDFEKLSDDDVFSIFKSN